MMQPTTHFCLADIPFFHAFWEGGLWAGRVLYHLFRLNLVNLKKFHTTNMIMNYVSSIVFLLLLIILLPSCEKENGSGNQKPVAVVDVRETVRLEFSFTVNKEVYLQTNYGEPPQIAVWLEYPDSTFYKTVWVTYRSAKQDWAGKVECAVALPYWDSRRIYEKEKPIFKKLIDAITGATVKEGKLKTTILVPHEKKWRYFIEVNVSGDYSEYYPYWSKSGIPDTEGNGQPSLVYSGKITADSTARSIPVLSGRTDQLTPTSKLIYDVDKITSAKHLLQNIQVLRK